MTDVAKARDEVDCAWQVVDQALQRGSRESQTRAIHALVAAVRAEERERCAVVCDERAADGTMGVSVAGTLTARIRALSGKP